MNLEFAQMPVAGNAIAARNWQRSVDFGNFIAVFLTWWL